MQARLFRHFGKLLLVFWAMYSFPLPLGFGQEALPANPEALEAFFVQIKPNLPLAPESLSLLGYEREKVARSWPILSPDKAMMATSEVYFLPPSKQTVSRVYLVPVGPQPALNEVLSPDTLQSLEKQRQATPTLMPTVDPKQVDPHAFWARYQPQKKLSSATVLAEAGFSHNSPYQFDVFQVVDWSEDGCRLLLLHRRGAHHLGLTQTIPALYDRETQHLERFDYLPDLIRKDFQVRAWGKAHGPLVDIRPLGWSRSYPEEMVVKLAVFGGESESTGGFWRLHPKTFALTAMGDTLIPSEIAQNGWTVVFRDAESKTYTSSETLPPPAPRDKQHHEWYHRVQFWKKHR